MYIPSISLCHPVLASSRGWSPNGCCRSRRQIQIRRVSSAGIVSHDHSPTNDWWFPLSRMAVLGRAEEGGREEQDFHDRVEKAPETETLVLTSLWVLLFLLGPEPGAISQPPWVPVEASQLVLTNMGHLLADAIKSWSALSVASFSIL